MKYGVGEDAVGAHARRLREGAERMCRLMVDEELGRRIRAVRRRLRHLLRSRRGDGGEV